jgi:hypothetical protein
MTLRESLRPAFSTFAAAPQVLVDYTGDEFFVRADVKVVTDVS